ncbi:glycoside hydrolase family 85 protein [Infundibulicybe gibba]|nr:glycoside hydrolase family 85 protein [Infundibulicybe gibba]
MPIIGQSNLNEDQNQPAYFKNLEELDRWADAPRKGPGDVLGYTPRPRVADTREQNGKLLVCHDYKGGYTESLFGLSYTFNFWSVCDTFVYFSHHRVTVPPPGWVNAAHRQGVKILGTLIFEGGAEPDCLRLLVGRLPSSKTGSAKPWTGPTYLPLSVHYARVLADLAHQRGFDGYLLNFECPLAGGTEQTQTLAAWITILQAEIIAKVGPHGQTIWYDSVVYTGQLAWQDRLNGYNLPFFLSSTGLFTNYTWGRDYPALSAQYFLGLDPSLTGNTPESSPAVSSKTLRDIYTGVDVWGRGSHGGGGFGLYKAITHIAPESLGLSVALFGQAWTWESEQDKPGWNWEQWWEYEKKLWVGPVDGVVEVPEAPRREGEPECIHGPFIPITSFFCRTTPPNPLDFPLHSNFCPGVGRTWFVEGKKVFQSKNGWTDVDKQTTVGDLIWPRPTPEWEGENRVDDLPEASASLCMEDAWNGGTSLRLGISHPGSSAEDAAFRHIWLPVQSLAVRANKSYTATALFKIERDSPGVDVDVGLSAKLVSKGEYPPLDIKLDAVDDAEQPDGWTRLSIQFQLPSGTSRAQEDLVGAIGLLVAIVAEDPAQPFALSLLLGQINVHAVRPDPVHRDDPMLLWADFRTSGGAPYVGTLSWDAASALARGTTVAITSPEDPRVAWHSQPSNPWFPEFMYFNIYVLAFDASGAVGPPEDASWIGTSGVNGRHCEFEVVQGNLPFEVRADIAKIRFYVQGVTTFGEVLPWDRGVYVDVDRH